jgi:FtsP/CotA-like multicopper oxidase with cupredoxin domain
MPKLPLIEQGKPFSRRQLIKLGLAGAGVAGAALALPSLTRKQTQPAKIPPLSNEAPVVAEGFNPMAIVRDFDYGTVKKENGRTIREFRIVAGTTKLDLNSAVSFITWNFNGRVPGPTLRAEEGDRVRDF